MGHGEDVDVVTGHEEHDAVREEGDLRRAHVRRTNEREREGCRHDARERDVDGREETMSPAFELALIAPKVRFELS